MTLYAEQSLHYKVFVKTAMVMALRNAFAQHPDENVRGTPVTLEYPTTETKYPVVLVKFFERKIRNVGVGHEELIDGVRYAHYWYEGDVELEIYALDGRTSDYLSNSVLQIITVGHLEQWTNEFFHQIYDLTENENPDAANNVLNVNSDEVQAFGEGREAAPWVAEDAFLFKNAYRVAVMGEYYSIPVNPLVDVLISDVVQYPYAGSLGEAIPTGDPSDSTPWQNF